MWRTGFCTGYSEERIKFAGAAGFDCLEVIVSPGGMLDINTVDDKKIRQIKETFDKAGISVGTIFCHPVNHLDPDPVKRKANNAYFIKILQKAREFGADVVCTNTWGNKNVSPEENIPVYKEVFSEYAKVAEKNGVRIAMENCPHSGEYPFIIKNISYSPAMWEKLFDAVPSSSIGLEFDPSHLYWQGINYVEALYNFRDRIYAFHAKDTEILKDVLTKNGVLGGKFWRFRLPGLGEINWKEIMRALYDINYQGCLIIEHEDPILSGPRTDEGLKLGLKHLRSFMV